MQLVDGFCFAYGVSTVLTVGKYRSFICDGKKALKIL